MDDETLVAIIVLVNFQHMIAGAETAKASERTIFVNVFFGVLHGT